MKKLIAILAFVLIAASAQAQNVQNLDLRKLDPQTAADVLRQINREDKKEAPIVSPGQAQEWAKVGENIAGAVAATAKALSIEANEFIKTPVGKWTFFFLFWYLVGKKIWMIVGGLLVWTGLGFITWRSAKVFLMPRLKLVSESVDEKGKKEKKYDWVSFTYKDQSNKAVVGAFHAIFFVVVSAIMLWTIF